MRAMHEVHVRLEDARGRQCQELGDAKTESDPTTPIFLGFALELNEKSLRITFLSLLSLFNYFDF